MTIDLRDVWSPCWSANSQALAYKALLHQFPVLSFQSSVSGGVFVELDVDDDADKGQIENAVKDVVEAVFDSAGRN